MLEHLCKLPRIHPKNMKIGPIGMSLYNQVAAFAFLKLFFTVRMQDALVQDSYL
jgi:hypothetical protein